MGQWPTVEQWPNIGKYGISVVAGTGTPAVREPVPHVPPDVAAGGEQYPLTGMRKVHIYGLVRQSKGWLCHIDSSDTLTTD